MTLNTRLAVAGLVSLLALAGAGLMAQSRAVVPVPEPVIVSGADIGFRIEGHDGTTPVGTLVVRVDGRWVAPRSQHGPVKLGSR